MGFVEQSWSWFLKGKSKSAGRTKSKYCQQEMQVLHCGRAKRDGCSTVKNNASSWKTVCTKRIYTKTEYKLNFFAGKKVVVKSTSPHIKSWKISENELTKFLFIINSNFKALREKQAQVIFNYTKTCLVQR